MAHVLPQWRYLDPERESPIVDDSWRGEYIYKSGKAKDPPEHYQELGKMPGNWNTCLAFRLHLALRFPASGTMRQEIVEVTQSVALCEGIPKPWPTWPRMNDQQGTERKHRPESQCAEAWPFLLLKPTRRQVGSGSYPS